MSGVQVVPHDRADTPTPPAVDLSMSPSSRHTPSSPEMTNGNYVPSGVSMMEFTHKQRHIRVDASTIYFRNYNDFYPALKYRYFLAELFHFEAELLVSGINFLLF